MEQPGQPAAGPGAGDDQQAMEELLVNELKAQGVFDQFRKDCLADVDTKPAYQNLRNRVDQNVSAYLSKITWRPTLNKNQLRNQLRKYVQDMSGVESGVDRIVDQIVNPKLDTTFMPQVEEVIYKHFGTSRPEEGEEDLLNGNDDPEEAEMSGEVQNGASGIPGSLGSSPGPGQQGGATSPLTPGGSPALSRGAISPLTPSNTPPPPAQPMEVDTVEEVQPPRPQSAYTPPPRTEPSYTPPPRPAPAPAPAPAPVVSQNSSGDEASMSSISDTDLGDAISPPRPARTAPPPATPPAPPAPPSPPAEPAPPAPPAPRTDTDTGSDEDLDRLERMKAELMAQLEGDFRISPEDSDSEEEEEEEEVEKETVSAPPGQTGTALVPPIQPVTLPAPPSQASPQHPPPPHQNSPPSQPVTPPALPACSPKVTAPTPSPPQEDLARLDISSTACKPISPDRKPPSPSGGSGGGGSGGSGGGHTAPVPAPPASKPSSAAPSTGSGSGGGQSDHRSSTQKSSYHSHSRHHHGSRDRKSEKELKKIKEQQKAKIEKYEQKIKSGDKIRSDKFQALDIFSTTTKPSTPHQKYRAPNPNSNSGSSTPVSAKPPQRDFEKKLAESIKKEKERREQEKERKRREEREKRRSQEERNGFRKPSEIEDRRSSGSSSSGEKVRRSSKDERRERDGKHRKSFDSDRTSHNHDSKSRRYSSSIDSHQDRHSSGSSSEKKESKYEKEREIQAMESRKRLTEAKEKKEKEEREKRKLKDKERRDKKDKEKAQDSAKSHNSQDDVKDILKEKICNMGVDTIQKMLMESLVEKSGATDKTGMMKELDELIQKKSPPKKLKLVGASPSKKKSLTKPKIVESSNTSESSIDSDEEIMEMKKKIKDRRKSADSDISAEKTKRPVRNKAKKSFSVESDKSDTDNDFIIDKVGKEVTNTVEEDPAKLDCPPTLSPAPAGRVSPKKVDKDPAIPSFTSFSAVEVAAALRVKEKYERLLAAEDLLPLSPVTEEELNAAIPVNRTVMLEPGPNPQAELAQLQQLGGNPRLVTPVPAWLQPHLLAAKCKEDSCEMPTKEEITNFLAKKNSGRGKKRGAGWDIVVDWVPAPQPAAKRSKLEKQLGFDMDSSFGNTIIAQAGKRTRRSNVRYSDKDFTSDEPSTPKQQQKIVKFDLTPQPSVVETNPNSTEMRKGSETVEMDEEPQPASGEKESPASPAEPGDRAETAGDPVVEEGGSPGKKRRSKDIIAAYLTSAGVERQIEGTSEELETPAADPTKTVGAQAAAGGMKLEEGTAEPVNNEGTTAVLAKFDAEISAADEEIKALVTNLTLKRKRNSSGESKFHGWATEDVRVAKTAYTSLKEALGTPDSTSIRTPGASFGMEDQDLLLSAVGSEGLLEVIISKQIQQDIKKLTTPLQPAKVATLLKDEVVKDELLESDTDDRGANSPESFGSSKENNPEICNAVPIAAIPTKRGSVTRRKKAIHNPVFKPSLEVS